MAFVGPVVHEDTVVVVTESGTVHGVALESGDRRWRERLPGEGWVPPLLDADRGTVTVATGDNGDEGGTGVVVSLDAATGEREWGRSLSTAARGATSAGGRVVLTTAAGRALAVDAVSGETGWAARLGPVGGPVDASDGTVAVMDETGVVHLLDAEGGDRLARFRTTDGLGDRCGWRPEISRVAGVHLDGVELLASAEWWMRKYDVSEHVE